MSGLDNYDADKNSFGCYAVAIRALRLEGVRAGSFRPNLDDPEEVAAALEQGFLIVQPVAHRAST